MADSHLVGTPTPPDGDGSNQAKRQKSRKQGRDFFCLLLSLDLLPVSSLHSSCRDKILHAAADHFSML